MAYGAEGGDSRRIRVPGMEGVDENSISLVGKERRLLGG